MSRYYKLQSSIYDMTRWAFLFGRTQLIHDLSIQPGFTVLEIGCGTGRNFGPIQTELKGAGRLIGVDCSEPMLARTTARVTRRGWSNVEVISAEYGKAPITCGGVDAVVLSYSLSMMPNWQQVLRCVKADLKPRGRVGVVDFCIDGEGPITRAFAEWLRFNHVDIERPFENVLSSMFQPLLFIQTPGLAGAWTYFRFIGAK